MSWRVANICADRIFGSPVRKQIIMFLADKASDDGSGIYCSKGTVQRHTELGASTVKRKIGDFIQEGILIETGQIRRCTNGYTVVWATRGETRDSVTAYLEGKILTGEIENRADIVAALHEVGLETPRQGKNYITAMDPDTGDRWRLKGRIYEKDWTGDAELDRGAAREGQGSEGAVGGKDERRAAQSRERLAQWRWRHCGFS